MSMSRSLSLFSAKVRLLNDRLALIHIPIDFYTFFLKPILQLIFHDLPPIEDRNPNELDVLDLNISEPEKPTFFNFSITPVECSIVCSRELAELYFRPLTEKFNKNEPSRANHVSISKDDFIAMQVDGQGLEAGQRVLELTSPLAMAGISIFFISTYFSDYILVPQRSKGHVTQALENRGFSFEVSTDAFVNSSNNPQYQSSQSSLNTKPSTTTTPSPSSLSELQTRTFASLRKHNIHARVDKSLRIVQCAAQYSSPHPSSTSTLRPSLVTTLILDNPRFLSLTLTATDPSPSILLEKRLLPRFSLDPICSISHDQHGDYSLEDGNNLLLGSKVDVLIPIMLDLRDLPLEATGIVCGVASRLATATQSRLHTHSSESENEGASGGIDIPTIGSAGSKLKASALLQAQKQKQKQKQRQKQQQKQKQKQKQKQEQEQEQLYRLPRDPDASYPDVVDISFLSTARAGTVIVGERELEKAIASLDAESGESS
ncbi:hypothetical protein PAAG_08878 [Paracoccidioides lutzii Pb01]|uniref:CASTOR ACT domain-containing protein n=1 Tax=Paracoccidioides lutzii (strain ATCC MYA-826 / Pb01) TaxID=502779 RepID=C1HDM1_PARBA|nr:hypothetical protein PAAG_08878 [Paracoccidioides lutzii Pb01]EEH40015.1 hypothetical protein PAAG_08878 [Paracoccidioides lutzii Pb01]